MYVEDALQMPQNPTPLRTDRAAGRKLLHAGEEVLQFLAVRRSVEPLWHIEET